MASTSTYDPFERASLFPRVSKFARNLHCCREADLKLLGLLTITAITTLIKFLAQVDHWLDQAAAVVSGGGFQGVCETLSGYLASRTFIVGHTLTIADLAVWGQLSCARQWEAIKRAPTVAHLVRWLNMCTANSVVADVASETIAARPGAKRAAAQAEKQKNAEGGAVVDTGGSFAINLENASEGNVVTRFPPEPSGYLHIGHAKAALLNQYFARQYKGKLIIRFDDTNPSKEKDEFVENIMKDCDALGLDPDVITYTSDSFQQILDIGTQLIKDGKIYIDDTPMEKMREERINRVDSACRSNTVERNLELWNEMIAGNEKGLECAARFRMDMQNDNGALRDPVAFRCNLTPHHRTGTKYKVYPTYDCACPFVDAIEVGRLQMDCTLTTFVCHYSTHNIYIQAMVTF